MRLRQHCGSFAASSVWDVHCSRRTIGPFVQEGQRRLPRKGFPVGKAVTRTKEQVVERRSKVGVGDSKQARGERCAWGDCFFVFIPSNRGSRSGCDNYVLGRASEAWVSAWFPDLRAHFGRSGLDGEIGKCRNHLSAQDFLKPACE